MSTIPKKQSKAKNTEDRLSGIEVLSRCRPAGLGLSSVKLLAASALKQVTAGPMSLCIVLASGVMMRRANFRFLGRRGATDVLAFDMRASRDAAGLAGDVMVSVPAARRQARLLGVPVREELTRYIIHGILHLAGYDDRTPAKKKRMWKKQEELVREAMELIKNEE